MSRKLTQRGSTLACIVVFLMLIAFSFYHRCQSHCFLIFPEYPNRLTLETFQVSFIKQRIKTVFLVCKYWKDFVCHSRLDFRDLSETFNHTQTRSHNSFPSYHGDMWYLRKCQKASSFFLCMLKELNRMRTCMKGIYDWKISRDSHEISESLRWCDMRWESFFRTQNLRIFDDKVSCSLLSWVWMIL